MSKTPETLQSLNESRKVAFGDILRAAMQDKEMGTRELASRMGVNVRRQYIQSILHGRIEPTADMLQKICDVLDAT